MIRDYRLGASRAPRRTLRVLLAEADPRAARGVCAALADEGITAAPLPSGQPVLDALAHAQFDVVALDTGLPGLGALHTIAQMRGRGDATTVVLMTGPGDAGLVVEALAAGARDFLSKSADAAYPALLARVLARAYDDDRAAQARELAEASRDVLMGELAHRVKNQLAVVSSIATSSGRRATDVQGFVRDFAARIQAISIAYDLLFKADWQPISIQDLTDAVLAISVGQVDVDLPPLKIDAQTAQAYGLALHEMAVNAVRHGALAHGGHLALCGDIDLRDADPFFVLNWHEAGYAADEPSRRGYGLMMIRNVLAQLDGGADFRWTDKGLHARLTFKLNTGHAA